MRYCSLLLVLAACGDNGHVAPDAAPAGPDGRKVVAQATATPNPQVDVLLVIDDSPDTVENQVDLGAAMGDFVAQLGAADWRVGVATSDMGTLATTGQGVDTGAAGQRGSCSGHGKDGRLTPGQATGLADPWLDAKRFTGDLAATLAAMVKVGADGCGFEQHLAGMQAALDGRNAGFLRDGASLLVIVEGDEDDCSVHDPAFFGSDPALGALSSFRCTQFGVTCADGGATPAAMAMPGAKSACAAAPPGGLIEAPATYAAALAKYGAHVLVGALAGPPEPVEVELVAPPMTVAKVPTLAPSCQFAGADGPVVANPGVRLAGFADVGASVCSTDQHAAMAHFGAMGAALAGSPCAFRAVTSPEACVAEDVVAGQVVATLPACTDRVTTDCWSLATDAARCPLDLHQALSVTRSGTPDAATVTRLRCP